jgi:hypothetical protein
VRFLPIRIAVLSAMLSVFVGESIPSLIASEKPAKLTLKDVKALIGTAKTPTDHRRLVWYFNHEAEKYEAEARDHEEMIEVYRKTPRGVRTIEHCEYLAKLNREMAHALREMAAAHEEMAKEASKK